MNLSGCRFKYGGNLSNGSYANATSSLTYGLMFGHVESEPYEQLFGSIESVNVFNARGNKNYFVGNNYSGSSIKFDAEVVTCSGDPLSLSDIKAVKKWLFYSDNYRRLYIYDDDADGDTLEYIDNVLKRTFLYCRFTNPKKIEGNGGIIGFSFTIEADSNMLYQDKLVYIYTSFPASVRVESDMMEYVYPKVTLSVGSSGGDVRLTVNNNGDTISDTKFVGLTGSISLVINSEFNFISGDNYSKFSSSDFPRLLDGDNTISVTGDVSSMTVEFSNRRYM